MLALPVGGLSLVVCGWLYSRRLCPSVVGLISAYLAAFVVRP